MRITLIGANGQLGSDLVEALSSRHALTSLAHAGIEIASETSVRMALPPTRPDLVISTAAFHQVPECEADPDRAFAVNATGQFHLAAVCADLGAPYLQFSTDYVFDGAKGAPYVETDAPAPLNVYGVSKLAGEHLIRFRHPRHYILRTSGLYGRVPCRAKGGNFVTTMLRLGREQGEVRVVDDEVLTPTSTRDLADAVARVIETERFGTYHVTSGGSCSWYQFACEIFRLARVRTPLIPVPSSEFSSPVRRPRWSVLENRALDEAGCGGMRPWNEALAAYMAENGLTG